MNEMNETILTPSSSFAIEMFAIEVIIDLLISMEVELSLELVQLAYDEVVSYSLLTTNFPLFTPKTIGELSKLLGKIEKEAKLYEHFYSQHIG